MRVLLIQEPTGTGLVWLAMGIEEWLCTQVRVGDSEYLALEDLGTMFDWRDTIYTVTMRPAPPAPEDIIALWEAASPFGQHPIGKKRIAEVRRLESRLPAGIVRYD